MKELKHASEYDFEPDHTQKEVDDLDRVITEIENAVSRRDKYCYLDIRLSSYQYVAYHLMNKGFKFMINRNHRDFLLELGITW